MENKLNLDALEGLFPEFTPNPIGEADVQGIKHEVIQEVNSIEDFMKDAPEAIKEEAQVETKEEVKEGETPENKETEVPTPELETQESDADFSPIKALAEWAKSEELFDFKEEEFEDNPDFLKGKLDEVAEKLAEKKLSEYPAEIHELAKNYKEGVPFDELLYSKSREIEYSGIKEAHIEEDKELQKRLVNDRLEEQGYTPEQIKKKIQKFEDAAMLDEEAKEAHQWLLTFEKKYQESLKAEASQRIVENEKRNQETLRNIEKEILSYDEILPGIKSSKEEKQKIFEAYTKQDRTGKTELIKAIEKDPVKAWAMITKLLVIEKGSLENVEKSIKSKVAAETKGKVKTYTETPGIGKLDIKAIKRWAEKNKANKVGI